ncbi:MAG TPA: hypothetical protein VGK73_24060 [Polyangiaceae bacterium]
MNLSRVFAAGAGGVRKSFESAGVAAAEVLQASTEPSSPDRVQVSENARQAAATPDSRGRGIEGAMVDLRVAKYLAVANMKVLETGAELARELGEIVKPTR